MTSTDIGSPTVNDLELLVEVSQLLTTLDLQSVMQKVIDLTLKVVGATRASLFLLEDERIDWQHIIHTSPGDSDRTYDLVGRVMDDGLAGWTVRNRQAVIVEDTEQDSRWFVDEPFRDTTRSAMCVPCLYDGEVVAVITLVHSAPGHFADHHLRLVTIIMNQATVALRNAQLFNRLDGQQRRLETVLRAIPGAIMVLDEQGRVLLVNQAADLLLGSWTGGKVIGQPLVSLERVDSALTPVQEVIREIGPSPLRPGTHWSFETRSDVLRKDFQVTMTVWEDLPQGIVGYLIAMNDITTLRDLHRFKDEMLRVASHDLSSPLSLIIGYVNMIGLDIPDPNSPVREYVDIILRSTERMAGLLDDLLRVERIRTSPLELHEQVDPQKLLKVVLVNMRPFAAKKSQQFESRLELDSAIRIIADPVLIRQAMENLIGNAIKYTPDGGRIVVEANVRDGRFHFTVEDTGFGVPQADIPYIFNSFYRAKTKSTQTITGKGLGLSLVKTVIERHRGEVWVESEEGVGSRFGFFIPTGESKDDGGGS